MALLLPFPSEKEDGSCTFSHTEDTCMISSFLLNVRICICEYYLLSFSVFLFAIFHLLHSILDPVLIAVICPWLLWLSLPFVILMLFLTHSILSPPKVLRIWKDLPHPLKLKFQNKIIINNELQTPRKATRYTGMISKIALTCKHHTEDAFSIIIRQLVWVWKVHLDSQICTLS